jgi:Plavaka transposase
MAHPLLVTVANIHMDIRLKASYHTLLLTALIPCVKFIGVKKNLIGALENRLFHKCLDIVCTSLKRAARHGE